MAITATAGSASATITARRPSWADMKKHYPASNISAAVLYDQMIGGKFKRLYLEPSYKNTCAVRMSYALNRSGLKLGEAPSTDGSPQGPDGFKYWIRVADLSPFLARHFKGADEELTLPVIPKSLIGDNDALRVKFTERVKLAQAWLDTKLAGRNGIVVFKVDGWGTNATGHFTLWDGTAKTLAYANGNDDPNSGGNYYFWLAQFADTENGTALIQLLSVKFWELK